MAKEQHRSLADREPSPAQKHFLAVARKAIDTTEDVSVRAGYHKSFEGVLSHHDTLEVRDFDRGIFINISPVNILIYPHIVGVLSFQVTDRTDDWSDSATSRIQFRFLPDGNIIAEPYDSQPNGDRNKISEARYASLAKLCMIDDTLVSSLRVFEALPVSEEDALALIHKVAAGKILSQIDNPTGSGNVRGLGSMGNHYPDQGQGQGAVR